MATILVIGDLHFRHKDIHLNRLLCNEVEDIVFSIQKLDAIVILGDTLDTNDHIRSNVLNLAVKFFLTLSRHTRVYVMIGNHDLKNNQVDLSQEMEADHPFPGLDESGCITIVDRVTKFSAGELDFCAVPYLPPGRYMNAIKDIDPVRDKITAFFSHQEFSNGDGFDPDAEEWPPEYPVNFCGHLHEHKVCQHNLILVGTPTTVDFGASPDKALMLIKFDADDKFEYERIFLKTVPLRLCFRFEANLSNIKNILNEIKSRTTPGIYKVVLFGKSSVLSVLRKSSQYVELKSLAKITEESMGAEVVMCEGIDKDVIMNGDYDEILEQLLIDHPEELNAYRELFPKI